MVRPRIDSIYQRYLRFANSFVARYFPYFITVAALVIVFVATMIWLIANRRLLPAIVMIGSFLLFILWMVGLISTAVELWGPTGSVAGNCQLHVFNENPTGATMETLAWLQQKSICKLFALMSERWLLTCIIGQSWYLVFSMALTGALFFVWVMVMSYRVFVQS